MICMNRPIRRKLYRRQISARIRLFYFPTIGSARRSEKSEQFCDEGEASDAFALASPSLLEESVCTKTNPFDGKCDLLSGSDTRKECGAASGISEQYEEQY